MEANLFGVPVAVLDDLRRHGGDHLDTVCASGRVLKENFIRVQSDSNRTLYSYPNQTIPEYFLPDKGSSDTWKMGPPPAFVSASNSEASFTRRSNFSRGTSLQSDNYNSATQQSCSSPGNTIPDNGSGHCVLRRYFIVDV